MVEITIKAFNNLRRCSFTTKLQSGKLSLISFLKAKSLQQGEFFT